jgi:alanine-glyoxylate transaminase/serine-glyoxylate transaminase/serine-pyruvate transaminase
MSGRHFLQIPGPTNVPERVLRAMDRAVPDHRGPVLPELVGEVLTNLKQIFQTTRGEIVLYPSSGTGAWEASIVNTLSPGDRVLAFNIGHFSHLYSDCARKLGVVVDEVDLPWSRGVPQDLVQEHLAKDASHTYRAVLVVHNETSTGVTSSIQGVRRAIDAAGHPALLFVDTVSSLASIDFRFDDWGVDRAPSQRRPPPPRRATSSTGARSWKTTAAASSPTPPPPCISSGCARPCACSSKKACRTCSPGTIAWPKACAARWRPGT